MEQTCKEKVPTYSFSEKSGILLFVFAPFLKDCAEFTVNLIKSVLGKKELPLSGLRLFAEESYDIVGAENPREHSNLSVLSKFHRKTCCCVGLELESTSRQKLMFHVLCMLFINRLAGNIISFIFMEGADGWMNRRMRKEYTHASRPAALWDHTPESEPESNAS